MTIHPRYKDQQNCKQYPDKVWAVLSHPRTTSSGDSSSQTTYDLSLVIVDPTRITWTPSPISTLLGFPLKLARWPLADGNSIPNAAANCLFFSTDVSSNDFGVKPKDAKGWSGDIVFLRSDSKPLDDIQVRCLTHYLNQSISLDILSLTSIPNGRPESVEAEAKQRAREKVARRLTPEAFHAYFEEWRLQQLVVGENEGVREVRSPVEVTFGYGGIKEACGTCGASEVKGKVGEGGKGSDGSEEEEVKLTRCSRCKARWYCSKTCQKKDWKEHKWVCKEPEVDEMQRMAAKAMEGMAGMK